MNNAITRSVNLSIHTCSQSPQPDFILKDDVLCQRHREARPMNLHIAQSQPENTQESSSALEITVRRRERSGSSQRIDKANWHHPMLELYEGDSEIGSHLEATVIPAKLYLVPTQDWRSDLDNGLDNEFSPKPTYQSELPEIEQWVRQYVVGCIEIWAGRRTAMQLARWSHRRVHQQLLRKSPIITESPKIRKIYISQPLESIAEATVTIRIGERVRSLILRFEGVDKRWLCTEMVIL